MEEAGVVHTCQRIRNRRALEFREQPGILQCDRRKIRDCARRYHVITRQHLRFGSQRHKGAKHCFFRLNRYGEQRHAGGLQRL